VFVCEWGYEYFVFFFFYVDIGVLEYFFKFVEGERFFGGGKRGARLDCVLDVGDV
jgi:hypothetical protein